jgi:DnaJ-class molecular chaperone
MAQGFYEILGIDNRSSTDAIHAAYHDQLAGLVRRLRAARRQGADVTILEGQERSLKEAMQILSDPVRRQRYDAYRRASRQGIPTSAETMWDVAKDSLVDPLAIASLEVLQKTTELNIGNV